MVELWEPHVVEPINSHTLMRYRGERSVRILQERSTRFWRAVKASTVWTGFCQCGGMLLVSSGQEMMLVDLLLPSMQTHQLWHQLHCTGHPARPTQVFVVLPQFRTANGDLEAAGSLDAGYAASLCPGIMSFCATSDLLRTYIISSWLPGGQIAGDSSMYADRRIPFAMSQLSATMYHEGHVCMIQ